jgi:ABC-2 type transport system permease protein
MNPTVAQLTARGLLGRRRVLLLIALPGVLILLAGASRALAGQNQDITVGMLSGFGLATLTPPLGLIAGTGVIAPEIDDGSIIYLLAKPLSRFTIVITKAAVAVGIVTVFAALGTLLAGLILAGTHGVVPRDDEFWGVRAGPKLSVVAATVASCRSRVF